MDPNRTPVQGSRPMLRRWMLTGAAAVPFLGAAATLSSVVKAELGVQVTGLALVVALLPLGVVVPAFLWLDRFEAEPKRYLGFAFLWGPLSPRPFRWCSTPGHSLSLRRSINRAAWRRPSSLRLWWRSP